MKADTSTFIFTAALTLLVTTASRAAPKSADLEVTLHGLHIRTEGVTQDASADVRVVIQEQTGLAEDTVMTAPIADDIAFFVRQRYLDLGYADVKISWGIIGNTAVLHVNEGMRYEVGEIRYRGKTAQPEQELTRLMLRRTHEKLDAVSAHPPFVAEDLRAGAGLVQRRLMADGYIDAVVAEPVFTKREAFRLQDVLVKITPGQLHEFGAIRVTGELLGQEAAIEKRIADLRDKPFNETKVEEVRTFIVGLYQQRGHFSAETTVDAGMMHAHSGRIPVTYHVSPGSQFRIIGLELAPGLSNGAQRLANSGFRRSVGKVYSPEELEVMHRHVFDSEVFARLDVTPKLVGEDTMVLDISGEEAKTRRYSAYAGYETFRGPVLGVESRKVNNLNTGNALRVKAEANGTGFNGGVTLIDPAVFNSMHSLELTFGGETEAVFDYERQSYLTRAILRRQWDRHVSTRLSADISMNQAESDILSPQELGLEEYQIASIGASAVFDYRNSPLVPTDGWYASLGVTGMFGDANYVRTDAIFSFYQPLTKRLRLSVGGKASMINTSSDVTKIPIDLRVFNGGATSVRSFPEREMGQKALDSDTPLGGLFSEVASVELSYEVAPNMELALFGDAGRLRPTDDFIGLKFSELRYAVGLGFRYKLPFGPLRMDYGWNPDREEGEPFGALHITFGFAF